MTSDPETSDPETSEPETSDPVTSASETANAAQSNQHYFSEEPEVESARKRIEVTLPDGSFEMETDTGVFSHGRVDAGTKFLLLEAPELPTSGDLLDLGCGAGVIALTMARRRPDCRVWAVDVNARARRLTSDNAMALGLRNVIVAAPDEVPTDVSFAAMWSNPPIKVGKNELHDMMRRWMPRLTRDGGAILVVNKNLGSDSLQKWLTDNGHPTKRLASRQGFRLLRVSTESR
jgi:16S rRNA G1207 methylase RsmC